MKKLCAFWGLFLFMPAYVFGKEPMRADDSIVVSGGKVAETGILADENGVIFLEFLQGTGVIVPESKVSFQGEILPPDIIPLTETSPRNRMRPVISFELLTNTGDKVSFVDRFHLKTSKNKVRNKYTNPNQQFQRSGAKFLTKISVLDAVNMPMLWEFNNKNKTWKKIGGKIQETPEPEIIVFSAIITHTGIYTIFDEDPPPLFAPTFPIDQIELVDQSPFPSVEPEDDESFFDENDFSGENDVVFLEEGDGVLPLETRISTSGGFENEVISAAPLGTTQIDSPFGPIPVIANPTMRLGDTREDFVVPAISEPMDNNVLIPSVSQSEPIIVESESVIKEYSADLEMPLTASVIEIPDEGDLPKTGKTKFPFVFVFAFGILVGSGYLAFKKKKHV